MNTMRYSFGLVVTAALVATGHWFPWPRRLRPAENTLLTISSILIGLLIWLGPNSGWCAVAGIALIGAIASASARLYDRLMNWRQQAALFQSDGPLAAGRTTDS